MTQKHEINFKAKIEVWSQALGDYENVGVLARTTENRVIIAPSKYAAQQTVARAFPISKPSHPKFVSGLDELSDLLPIRNSNIDNKLNHLLAGYAARNPITRLEALLTTGPLEKHGLRLSSLKDEPQTMREKNIARVLNQDGKQDEERARRFEEISEPLANIVKAMKVDKDVELYAGSESYIRQLAKSHGGQNYVIPVSTLNMEGDGYRERLLKVDLTINHNEEINLEAVANRVIQGAGFSAPNIDVETIKSTDGRSAKVLLMDNFALMDGFPAEIRRVSFAALLGKSDDEIHEMTYDEMSDILEVQERQLPEVQSNPARLDSNKQALFQWAMVNSALNNIDNHGRNLEVIISDDGTPEVSPFFDVNFSSFNDTMSTCLDGRPPIHRIDIQDDKQLKQVWDQLGIKEDFTKGLDMRDALVKSICRIPEYCEELDVRPQEQAIIESAIGMQSVTLSEILSRAKAAHSESKKVLTTDLETDYGMGHEQ